MCGCMLMHGMMNHEAVHHPTSHPTPTPTNSTPLASGEQRCAHCDFPLQQGFAFCPNCGMSLRMAECEACGQKVDPIWEMCAYCGSPLSEAQGQPEHQ
jgi:predicted amidophosphoribosyltransferase